MLLLNTVGGKLTKIFVITGCAEEAAIYYYSFSFTFWSHDKGLFDLIGLDFIVIAGQNSF